MVLVSVVVPVYYNAPSLPLLVGRLRQVAAGLGHLQFEWVFVDDGSGDDSFSVLRGLSEADARVRVLRLSRNFGSNAAILAGLSHCQGDCAVVISADLQDPPEVIPELIVAWEADHEVVMASRRSRDDPLLSRWLGTAFNRLFRRFVFRDFPADGFDFMLLDRQVVRLIVNLQEKNSYIFGQTMWVGFRRAVIYYDRQARPYGESRWTTAKKVKYFIDAFSAFSYLPLRLASLLGMGLGVVGFLYALLIVILRLLADIPVEGWASLSVIVLVTSGAQLMLVGILGEYLWRTLEEVRRRPPYIVATTINVPSTLEGPTHLATSTADYPEPRRSTPRARDVIRDG